MSYKRDSRNRPRFKRKQKRDKTPLWDIPPSEYLVQTDGNPPAPGIYQITGGKFAGSMYTVALVDVPAGEPWRVRVVTEDVGGEVENIWEMDAGSWAVLVETDGLRLTDASEFECPEEELPWYYLQDGRSPYG